MDSCPSSPEQPPQDLWGSILDSVSSSRSIPSKQIFLLSQPSAGKSTLAAGLLQKPLADDKDDHRTDFAVGYDFANVRDDADEDTLVCLSVYTVVVCDPRKAPGFRRPPVLRPPRTDFMLVAYEHDANSSSPPPSTVLITNFPALVPTAHLQRHLAAHGAIAHLHRPLDTATGAALGVVAVRFATAEEARKCAEREDGAQGTIAGWGGGGGEAQARRAVMDAEGLVLKALMREMEGVAKRDREERRRREREKERERGKEKGRKAEAGTPKERDATTPVQGKHKPAHPSLPPNPLLQAGASANTSASPAEAKQAAARVGSGAGYAPRFRVSAANAVGPAPNGGGGGWSGSARYRLPPRPQNSYRPRLPSRSPSPDRRFLEAATRDMGRGKGKARDPGEQARARADTVAELARNGRDHLRLKVDGSMDAVRDDDVWEFCKGFAVEKVRAARPLGYICDVQGRGTARRAERVLRGRMLGYHGVTLAVGSPAEVAGPVRWDNAELVARAQELVYKELREFLGKDITDRVVGTQMRRIAAEQRGKSGGAGGGAGREDGRPVPAKRDLKSLSFRKQKEVEVVEEHEEEREEEQLNRYGAEQEGRLFITEERSPTVVNEFRSGIKHVFMNPAFVQQAAKGINGRLSDVKPSKRRRKPIELELVNEVREQ
ncbi:hypothetical protein DFH09DRAFT_1312257 [Mycena vulgaris]|nr:hypothetical protein DFH09DRAFT_1312257 [Mycena vulgaris]